ncbi:MAG TPA: hypothetical protein VKB51_03420 [bacterium]|nr:hypothetical protein [bacterium]
MTDQEAPQQTQEQINDAEWQNSANWRFGLFYYSPRDSRVWVPKRSMFGRRRYGGTPNFAQPSARQYMMLIVTFMLALFLLVVLLERWGVLR